MLSEGLVVSWILCVCMCRGAADLLFHITPSTGDDVDKKYIYLDLHIFVSEKVRLELGVDIDNLLFVRPQYPQTPAEITISQSRGISDARRKEYVCSIS